VAPRARTATLEQVVGEKSRVRPNPAFAQRVAFIGAQGRGGQEKTRAEGKAAKTWNPHGAS
jgi:hypothetical protein